MGSESSKLNEDAQNLETDSMDAKGSRKNSKRRFRDRRLATPASGLSVASSPGSETPPPLQPYTPQHPNQRPVKQETLNRAHHSSEQPSSSLIKREREAHNQKAQFLAREDTPVGDSFTTSGARAGISTATTLAPSSTSALPSSTSSAPPTIVDAPIVHSLTDRNLDTAPTPEGPSEVQEIINLWDIARTQFQEKNQRDLGIGEGCDINLIESFIQDIQKRKEKCDEKRWFYRTKAGQKVFYLDSVIEQLNKYALIGDLAIQHHPDIVALAWAGFRFILQVGTAYTDNMRSIADGLSSIIRILCCCDIYERLYISKNLQINTHLADSIVELYVSILEYMSYAGEHLQKSTAEQIWDSFLNGSAQKLESITKMEKMVIAHSDIAEKEAARTGRIDQLENSQNLKYLLFGMENIFSLVQEDRCSKILMWLSNMPFASHHSYFHKQRREGTGGWLLEHEKYGAWKMSDKSSIFWLRGGPGCGKSYLASKVIDHVLDEIKMNHHKGHVAAYVYCHYNEEGRNDPGSILRAIIKQLCLSMGGFLIPKEVLLIYEERERQGHSSGPLDLEECRDLIIKLCEGYTTTTIVIDALDECNDKERRALSCALDEIVNKTKSVKIFVTGRDIKDIRETLFGHPDHYVEESDNKADINFYIQSEIDRRSQLRCGVDKPLLNGIDVTLEFKSYVISKLQEKANGMFMWAQFQIDALCEERTEDHVRAALDALPESLDKTYDRALSKVNEHNGSDGSIAKRVLTWILCAETPCSPETIIQSLAVEPGQSSLKMSQLKLGLQDILDVCQNLIIYDEKLDTLRFAHFSVQEYLRRHPDFTPGLGHGRLAEICMRSFMYGSAEVERLYLLWELREYSASNWATHVRLSGDRSVEICMAFLKSTTAFNKWVRVALEKGIFEKGVSAGFTPLWVACYYGLQNIVEEFLLRDVSQIDSTNPCGAHGETPLLCAIVLNNQHIVRTLLTAGANANMTDSSGSTPLSIAVGKGHVEIVRMLLEIQDVDMRKTGKEGETLLWEALGCGNEEIVQMLLDVASSDMGAGNKKHTPPNKTAIHSQGEMLQALLTKGGVDLTKARSNGDTALMKAVTAGTVGIVRMLLAAGADVNARIYGGSTPLIRAAEYGYSEVVQILLAAEGVDVNKANSDDQSPLFISAEKGNVEIVRILLAAEGVDVNKADNSGRSPLFISAEKGNVEIVRILLAAEGVDVNKADNYGRSPLFISAEKGNVEIVRILLAAEGVDVNKADGKGRSPLYISAMNGNAELVQILLAAEGVDVNKADGNEWPPLLISVWNGNAEIVQILLAAEGVDVNQGSFEAISPLATAVYRKNKEIVSMILSAKGALVDVNLADEEEDSPLICAVRNRQEEIVRMLLAAEGIDVNKAGVYIKTTPLVCAIDENYPEIVRLLLAVKDVDVNKPSPQGNTPLVEATMRRKEEMVRMLLTAGGVDINRTAGEEDCTPLAYAVEKGYSEIASLLLDMDGVDVNKPCPSGDTPLLKATKDRDEELVRKLLAAEGVDLNKSDNDGNTALFYALKNQLRSIIPLLRKAARQKTD